ncbi:MAG: RHS repeat-associated core domain-containing protein [Thermomicrobiales bacterium]
MSVCAASCFAATASHSTVPYYTLDAPRSVALMYHGDRAFPRPFVYADVSIPFAPTSVQEYWLEVRRNGVDIPFVNGDNKLIFAGTSTPAVTYRLAGQMDMSSDPTGVDSVTVLVTAVYANSTSDVAPVRTQIMRVNTQASTIAKGWAIAGLQRIYYAPEGQGAGYMIANGDGSATYFAGTGGTATDFSVLSLSDQVWTRAYLDGTRVLFDASGRMTAVIDRLGRQTQFQYNGWNLTTIIEPMRASGLASTPYISLGYGANGLLETITETGGAGDRITRVTVDPNGRLTRITDPDGVYTGYDYDGSGRLAYITDRRGNTTQYVYGPTWKLAQIISPPVPVDAGGGATTVVNPTTTLLPWQDVGVPLVSTAGNPAPLLTRGASVGRIISATSDTTSVSVDRWGQVTQATDPIGHTTVIERDGRLPTVIHHSDGSVDSASYANGLPTTLRGAGKSTVHIRYGVFAQPDSVWGGGSAAQRIFINSTNGTVDSVRHAGPTPNVAYFTHDGLGRLMISRDEAGHTTQYGFDPTWGSTTAVTAPNNTTVNTTLDAHGRAAYSTNGVDAPITVAYDSLNRQVSVTQGVNATAATTIYDGILPTDVTDRNANTTHTDYNALGWATARCDPTGHCMQYHYDASGRLTSETNRRGQRIDRTYDHLGRLLTKSGDNTSTDSFSYSADDRGMTAQNTIETDSLRVMPGTSVLGAADTSITWINGARYQVIHGDLGSWAGRDSTVITTTAPNVTFRKRYVYADTVTGMITSFADGFNTTSYSYTGDFLQTAASNATGNRNTGYLATHAISYTNFSAAGLTELARTYHYDGIVRIDQLFTNHASRVDDGNAYGYDSNGRLWQSQVQTGCTAALSGGSTTHGSCTGYAVQDIYTYDPEGNRNSQGGSYTSGNRVVTLGGYTYEHDLDGNIARRYNSASGEDNHYTWSSDNRLTDATVQLDTSSSPEAFHYDYNAYGKLALRSIGAALERVWVHDRSQLLGEFDAANGNQRVAEYIYSEGADAPYAVVLGATTPTSINYVELNAAGNVVGTHNGTSITMTASYDDWGNPSVGVSRVGNLFWKGLPRDEYTGLYYVQARWYDPALGRFISEDPAGFAGGLNPYTFADDDPVNGSDPTGLFAGGIFNFTGGCSLYCQFFSRAIHSPSKLPAPDEHKQLRGSYSGDAHDPTVGYGGLDFADGLGSGITLGGGRYSSASESGRYIKAGMLFGAALSGGGTGGVSKSMKTFAGPGLSAAVCGGVATFGACFSFDGNHFTGLSGGFSKGGPGALYVELSHVFTFPDAPNDPPSIVPPDYYWTYQMP